MSSKSEFKAFKVIFPFLVANFLIIILSLPIFIDTPFILDLWLENVPEHTILFTRLVILTAIIDSIAYKNTLFSIITPYTDDMLTDFGNEIYRFK